MDEAWRYELDSSSVTGMDSDLGDVYVSTDNDGVFGFDSGDEQWFLHGLVGRSLDPPVFADGVLYVTESYGDLVALDAVSGDEQWSWSTSNELSGGVRVLGRTVYLADGSALVGIDADSGTADWEQSPGGSILDIELL